MPFSAPRSRPSPFTPTLLALALSLAGASAQAEGLAALPPLDWRVRGVLPAVGVAALFGPSASGKSFLGFDLAANIAEGSDWFGRRVKAAPVVYLISLHTTSSILRKSMI